MSVICPKSAVTFIDNGDYALNVDLNVFSMLKIISVYSVSEQANFLFSLPFYALIMKLRTQIKNTGRKAYKGQ